MSTELVKEFLYLDDEEYYSKICKLDARELYNQHAQASRGALSGTISTAINLSMAPLTLGASLFSTPLTARRMSVNKQRKTLIERRLRELKLSGYSLQAMDYLIPIGAGMVSMGSVPGADFLLEEGIALFAEDAAAEAISTQIGDITDLLNVAEVVQLPEKTQHGVAEVVPLFTEDTDVAAEAVFTQTGDITDLANVAEVVQLFTEDVAGEALSTQIGDITDLANVAEVVHLPTESWQGVEEVIQLPTESQHGVARERRRASDDGVHHSVEHGRNSLRRPEAVSSDRHVSIQCRTPTLFIVVFILLFTIWACWNIIISANSGHLERYVFN